MSWRIVLLSFVASCGGAQTTAVDEPSAANQGAPLVDGEEEGDGPAVERDADRDPRDRACRDGDLEICRDLAYEYIDSDLNVALTYQRLICDQGGDSDDIRYACSQVQGLQRFLALMAQDPGAEGRRAAEIANAVTGDDSVEGILSYPLVVEVRGSDCNPEENADCVERTEHANEAEYLAWWEQNGDGRITYGGERWLCGGDAHCEGHYTDYQEGPSYSIGDMELVRIHLNGGAADRLEFVIVAAPGCPDHC